MLAEKQTVHRLINVDLDLEGSVPILTHCILVDSPTVICWTSPFVILGVSGLFCSFHSYFDGNSVSKHSRTY